MSPNNIPPDTKRRAFALACEQSRPVAIWLRPRGIYWNLRQWVLAPSPEKAQPGDFLMGLELIGIVYPVSQ